MDNEGEITLSNAATIQTIIRHEARAQLLGRWLRLCEPELPLRMQRLADISKATTARDKAIGTLKLDRAGDGIPGWPALPELPDDDNSQETEA